MVEEYVRDGRQQVRVRAVGHGLRGRGIQHERVERIGGVCGVRGDYLKGLHPVLPVQGESILHHRLGPVVRQVVAGAKYVSAVQGQPRALELVCEGARVLRYVRHPSALSVEQILKYLVIRPVRVVADGVKYRPPKVRVCPVCNHLGSLRIKNEREWINGRCAYPLRYRIKRALPIGPVQTDGVTYRRLSP